MSFGYWGLFSDRTAMAYWLSEPGVDNNPIHHIPTAEAMSYRPFDPRAGEADLESGWAKDPETGKPQLGDEKHSSGDLHSSIAEHGVQSPVEIFTDGENAMMFDGVHRTTIAHELGHPTIPAYIHHMSPADLLAYQEEMGDWDPQMGKVGEGVQGALSGPNPPVMHPPWWIHTNSPPDILGGQQKNLAYEQKWRRQKRQSRTAATDGIRYAHIVEADVAEDLWRLAMAWDQWADKIKGGCLDGCGLRAEGRYTIPQAGAFMDYIHRAINGKPAIHIISVYTHPSDRGSGAAEAMIRRLVEDHPGHLVNPGTMTNDGQKFHDRLLDKDPARRDLLA